MNNAIRICVITIASLVFLSPPGFGDIVVTADGMIVNGKIIEQVSGSHVTIANYHGTFTIKQENIREQHSTDNYRKDIELFKKMGKTASEAEVKKNYEAGIEKLQTRSAEGKGAGSSAHCLLLACPFVNFNIDRLGSIVPCSFGVMVLSDVRFHTADGKLVLGPRLDLQYFYSKKGIKSIEAFRFAAGPAFIVPVYSGGFSLNLSLVPELGAGYYGVTGREDETADFKMNFFFTAGLEFVISSWMITPMIRFDYVHDGTVPLYGIGISLGAGYLFNYHKSSLKDIKSGG
ncbi:MAG TPA: hypothetical protein PK926_14575 [Spirochaetota bacterium]|nr:hypothetical protein [Spirochaetota bacterium]HPI89695.1 hypothetical protein [Spirochaetota bacterium]HPR48346.1 hypothetical protein [Spirochaetota bacterium]